MVLVLDVFLRGLLVIVAVILFTRIQGLRSFSKMSSFDFSLTVAFGSLIAGSMLSVNTSWWVGLIAVATVFVVQGAVSFLRVRSPKVEGAVDNSPLLLMRNGEVLDGALDEARMTEGDLLAKLREANVLSFEQVHAVVMESTGDVSVLHQEGAAPQIDRMIEGVRVPEARQKTF